MDHGERIRAIEAAVQSSVLGQEAVIRECVACLLAGGHALLEGPPGVAKTLLVKSLASATGLSFSRIQFTPDLLPADVTGTDVIVDMETGRDFEFRPGPLFGNLVLADEINRATPRTQSALIEGMAEGTVSIGTRRHDLPDPFCVMATQNPIEHEGTFPLPEAQLDRFLLKVVVPPPDQEALVHVLERSRFAQPPLPDAVVSNEEILALQSAVRDVEIPGPPADTGGAGRARDGRQRARRDRVRAAQLATGLVATRRRSDLSRGSRRRPARGTHLRRGERPGGRTATGATPPPAAVLRGRGPRAHRRRARRRRPARPPGASRRGAGRPEGHRRLGLPFACGKGNRRSPLRCRRLRQDLPLPPPALLWSIPHPFDHTSGALDGERRWDENAGLPLSRSHRITGLQ